MSTVGHRGLISELSQRDGQLDDDRLGAGTEHCGAWLRRWAAADVILNQVARGRAGWTCLTP